MPVYEYVCATCRNRFEKLRPMSGMDDDAPCPDCGTHSARTLSVFSAFIKSPGGDLAPVGGVGGGCGCSDGGGCGCSGGMEF